MAGGAGRLEEQHLPCFAPPDGSGLTHPWGIFQLLLHGLQPWCEDFQGRPETLKRVCINRARVSLCQEFLPLLEKAAKGAQKTGLSCSRAAIVNVSSKVGSIGLCLGVLEAPMYPYRASKVRGWGRRWGPWRGAHGTPPPAPGHPSPAWSSKGEHAEHQPKPCPCSTAGQSPFPTSTALQLQNVPLPPICTQLPEPSVVLAWPCLFQAAQNMVTRCLAAELRDKGLFCVASHPVWVKANVGTGQVPPCCAGNGQRCWVLCCCGPPPDVWLHSALRPNCLH